MTKRTKPRTIHACRCRDCRTAHKTAELAREEMYAALTRTTALKARRGDISDETAAGLVHLINRFQQARDAHRALSYTAPHFPLTAPQLFGLVRTARGH